MIEENAVSSHTDSLEGSLPAETFSSIVPPDVIADTLDVVADTPDVIANSPDMVPDIASGPNPVQFSNNEVNADIEAQHDLKYEGLDTADLQNVEQPMVSVNVRRRWQVPKSQRMGRNGFHGNHNLQLSKLESSIQKHAPSKDRGVLVNSSKVWAKKFKGENDEDSLRPRPQELAIQTEERKCELIIGSISVPVRNCISRKKCSTEQGKHKLGNASEEAENKDNLQSVINRGAAKHWRPVSRNEKLDDRTASDGSCLHSSSIDDEPSKNRECSDYSKGAAVPSQFSSVAAKAFLAERMLVLLTLSCYFSLLFFVLPLLHL